MKNESRAQSQLHTILTSIPETVLGVDHNYRLLYCYPKEDFPDLQDQVGTPLDELFSDYPDFVKITQQKIDQIFAGEAVSRHEHQMLNQQGKWNHYEMQIVVCGEKEVILFLREITELRTLQNQLIQTAKLASLGEMAASVVHEINQPLMIMSLAAEIGQHDLKKQAMPQVKSAFQTILQQVKRASGIIRHLRSFGWTKGISEQWENDLNQSIHDVLVLFRVQLQMESVNVGLDLDPDLPLVVCDPHQIKQVLGHLISNARYALQEASDKHLIFRTFIDDPWCVIEVQDTGTGISNEDLPKIFEPFFSTKQQPEASGLGLAVSQGILEAHQGEIIVQSTPEGGTTVQLRLPLDRK